MKQYFLTPKGLDNETKRTQKGFPADWIRTTYIVKRRVNERIKALAYWQRLTVKEVVNQAFTEYLDGKM